MLSIKNKEYNKIVNHILNNEQFNVLDSIEHHGISRLDHSLKVSYYSYKVAKMCHLDYKEVARAGLLHDFYLDRTVDYNNPKDKFLLFTTKHPIIATENSKNYFKLTEKEEDIIKSHMFPVDFRVPKYAESWIVNLVDKSVSVYEFGKKFKYQLTYGFNFFILFSINIMK